MTTGKVERWSIVNGKGELHGPYTGPETARDAATDFDKIRPGHAPHRPLLLREVDPAHDAAVSRLVEAARAAVTKWLQAGIVSATDLSTLQAAVANAFPAPETHSAQCP